MRTTVFIGAGAALEIGGASTTYITEEIKKIEQVYGQEKDFFIQKVADELSNVFKNDSVNFEDIFHVIEQIATYQFSWIPPPHIPSKVSSPALSAFVSPKITSIFDNGAITAIAKIDIIRKVAYLVNEYNQKYIKNVSFDWHTNFWEVLKSKSMLDIATLNYDTIIEQIIKDYNDGFEPTTYAFKRFNPKNLLNDTTNNKIMHLHGCIDYGYIRNADINEFIITDHHEDLYRYPSYNEAKETWFGKSVNKTQAGEDATIGPLITGLHKTDKIQPAPYAFYNAELINSINRNNSLLVIGYSFGDKHLNKILEKMATIHGSRRKIVFIDWADKSLRSSIDNSLRDSRGPEMIANVSRSFQEFEPFKKLKNGDHIISQDGRARLYLDGFKNTINKYGGDIIDFLCS